MRNHPGRALTVLCGIALGAAVFTSVRLSVHASLDSFSKSMDLIAGRADRVLIQPGGHVPEKLVPLLLKHPAIAAASPILTTYVKPLQPPSDPFLLIGLDPILDRSFREWQITAAGRPETGAWLDLIREPNTIIIGQPLALKYECSRGDSLTLVLATRNYAAGRPRLGGRRTGGNYRYRDLSRIHRPIRAGGPH